MHAINKHPKAAQTQHGLASRVIILTGAPQSKQLNWHEDHLAKHADAGFGRTSVGTSFDSSDITTPFLIPKWRSLRACLPTMSGQKTEDEETEFLSTGAVDIDLTVHREDAAFAEHSIAFLEGTARSSLKSTGGSIDATMQSFYSALSEAEQEPMIGSATVARITSSLTITNLRDVPNAGQIQKIGPKPVNLLVAVIAVRPLRTVQLRRRNAQMNIAEVVVGDETKAGFTITVWLVPEEKQASRPGDLRSDVMSLRPGEMVLFSNIALSAYKGCVYGQSLSMHNTCRGTSVLRLQGHHLEQGGLSSKVSALSTWTQRFLGLETSISKKAGTTYDGEVLPPETPDG